MKDIKLGVYEHYKGNKYLLLGLAYHSETLEPMIVYLPLYEKSGAIWVRPFDISFEDITIDGVTKSRFRYLGPELADPRQNPTD
jgi:hypothetical protein